MNVAIFFKDLALKILEVHIKSSDKLSFKEDL